MTTKNTFRYCYKSFNPKETFSNSIMSSVLCAKRTQATGWTTVATQAINQAKKRKTELEFNIIFFVVSSQELESPNATTDEFNLSVNCHLANLVLPPKKGTAIMWYNNFIDPDSGLLGSVDRYSLHGGCDVIKGEKWIANNWLTAPTKYSRHIRSIYDSGF